MSGKKTDELSDKDAALRRDEIVRRMLATPPKPFTPPSKPKKRKRGAAEATPRQRHKK